MKTVKKESNNKFQKFQQCALIEKDTQKLKGGGDVNRSGTITTLDILN